MESVCTFSVGLRMRIYSISLTRFKVKVLRFKVKVFIIVHYFNSSQQKEITIYKKSNIKIALNYIDVKSI